MIHFSLTCEQDHAFEGWFRGSGDYADQLEKGHLLCPYCGSSDIRKALMAPAVSTSRGKEAVAIPKPEEALPASPPAQQLASIDPQQQQVLQAMRALRDKITENADDVGNRFAEEARKMHFGESEKRGIYGQADIKEVNELHEDGIEFFAMPSLPEEKN